MASNIIKTITDLIPSPESIYDSLGAHWEGGTDGSFAEHPVCDFADVDSFEPGSEAEEVALSYARAAASWAESLVSLLGELVAGDELADTDDVATILSDASDLEYEYGDDPLVSDVRAAIEQHFLSEVESAENLEDLLEALVDAEKAGVGTDDIITDLPTFGGEDPSDTAEVWSWDETRLLVGRCVSEFAILPRSDYEDW